jgi:hypothetical protein
VWSSTWSLRCGVLAQAKSKKTQLQSLPDGFTTKGKGKGKEKEEQE